MVKFDPKKFEKKWQKTWHENDAYKTEETSDKPSCYVLDMFPYPSGSSMHVGHPRGYVATDVYSRFKRMNGFNVLHPMGWDAFGLPAEETAIANKEYPTVTVERNITKFKTQLQMLGLSYDWSREINTTDANYYAHTQRIFLQFFKQGLAINKTMSVNWCPELGTVLANEDIVNGKSERGGFPVFQMPMRQWVLAITKYADRLVEDLELLPEWPDKVKNAQRAWIGKSEGHQFAFPTDAGVEIPVFTTKLETLPGVTFLAIAPESELTKKLLEKAQNATAISDYIEASRQKTELDRQQLNVKTGVIIEGVNAVHPLTGSLLPIVVADYVLASYGTGAVMAVPAKDERDADMAKVLSLPIIEFAEADTKVLGEKLDAKSEKRYKIRDWVFSRQRFWGEPFPIVWVEGKENYDVIAQGPVGKWLPAQPVSYKDDSKEYFAVPVIPEYLSSMQLPVVKSYEPTGNIEGPLAGIPEWVNAFVNPETGEVANKAKDESWIAVKRETNTMPQWAGSSWYWLRFMDPHNNAEPFSKEAAKYWGAVDVYAGADHAVAHLIYARFWHKVMQDAGLVDYPEPFKRLEFLGYILASDGTKISKRKGNSRSPEEVVDEVGADAFRLYEMFIGPFEKPAPWNDNDLTGAKRFLERVWRFAETTIKSKVATSSEPAVSALQKTIAKVEADIESFKFNTAVSSLMIGLNEMQDEPVALPELKQFLKLLAPFVPHMAEELWQMTGETESIHQGPWPKYDASLIVEDNFMLPVQINGKHRFDIAVSKTATEDEVKSVLDADDSAQKYLANQTIKKIIYVPGRIVSLVI